MKSSNHSSNETLIKTKLERVIDLFLALRLLTESINQISNGNIFFSKVLYGQLRALLTDNTQIRHHKRKPILFDLADALNVELFFFYLDMNLENEEWFSIEKTELMFYDLSLSIEKKRGVQKIIELEKFLDSPMMVYKGKNLKIREIINNLSDKLGGSHYDPTIPADIHNLTNMNWGSKNILDNHILEFSRITIELGLKIPKLFSDIEILFCFSLSENPENSLVIFEVTLPRSSFQISLIRDKNQMHIELIDLVNSRFNSKLKTSFIKDKIYFVTISHCINEGFKSRISIYIDGVIDSIIESSPLLLFNAFQASNVKLNIPSNNNHLDYKFYVSHIQVFTKVLSDTQRLNLNEFVKSKTKILKEIKPCLLLSEI